MQYHSSWPIEAQEHFENTIKAHGGWNAWETLESFSFKLKYFRGALMFAKGLHRTFHTPQKMIVNPKKRQVDFIYGSHTDKFEDGKILYMASTVRLSFKIANLVATRSCLSAYSKRYQVLFCTLNQAFQYVPIPLACAPCDS